MLESILRYGLWGVGLLAGLIATVFVVFFLGGLSSAYFEVRSEKRAGKTPTRPAWEQRAKRRARGRFSTVKALWESASHRGVEQCWCARGPVQWFEAAGPWDTSGYGCAAWEAEDVVAMERHQRAGGYARTSSLEVARRGDFNAA